MLGRRMVKVMADYAGGALPRSNAGTLCVSVFVFVFVFVCVCVCVCVYMCVFIC